MNDKTDNWYCLKQDPPREWRNKETSELLKIVSRTTKFTGEKKYVVKAAQNYYADDESEREIEVLGEKDTMKEAQVRAREYAQKHNEPEA